MFSDPEFAILDVSIPDQVKDIAMVVTASDRAFAEITKMSNRLNLTRVITEHAERIFKDYDRKVPRGRSRLAIASACLYVACHQEDVPRTLKEKWAKSWKCQKNFGYTRSLCLEYFPVGQ